MIFNLFKSKPTLKELIPNGFVDIHSHILPGIDDGAKDTEESLELITEMKKLGFSKIIGTPHTYSGLYENSIESIESAYKKLKINEIRDINIDFASEYMLDKTIIERVRNKEILCLNENYVLVEMSYISMPVNLNEILFEIIHNGYKPVLAHPERYFFFHNDFKAYFRLKKMGCYFQMNLLSITDYYGKGVGVVLKKLIKYGLIDFCGSDIHSLKHIEAFKRKINGLKIDLLENILEKNSFFI